LVLSVSLREGFDLRLENAAGKGFARNNGDGEVDNAAGDRGRGTSVTSIASTSLSDVSLLMLVDFWRYAEVDRFRLVWLLPRGFVPVSESPSKIADGVECFRPRTLEGREYR
jgi:hypothetical protein